ncbi:MAG TPA: ATP-binding cassette domain-containing protein [Thermodesulfovibrio thiophilus]|uniref:ABC transporter ATP-binding protein n=1 Tax=Thermodesulfovibrio thiophilus TaxID=340095 RepID=UPI0004087BCE|nr:ATP-binding cassette domain-containing protein [Thermodesulfovibrio thiophilus]HHW20480.1 ATP-binding cassette domain-containing protein [Thermodesulfovibrio thiophilus]HOA83398.1 ATP-binding cassette domain-containing protein [Thermodesulfovibrio thiophilus]HQD36429.1 ATP-binding cassette domain-containing protein [Thermodesulfovibrio thiophilus]
MIKLENISKSYGKLKAVQELNLEIKKGEIFGLLGPNGAGKTTTVKILTTLTRPDSGKCFIDGIDVINTPQEIKSIIGVVPQENNLERELTVYENLLIYGMLHRVKDLKLKINERIESMKIADKKQSIVSTLSGGLQRRTLVARALLPEPKVLFLDEPSIGLDPQIRRELWQIIRKIKFEGKTVFLTTHYIEEAEALCDRVGILSHGKLIALGSPSELKRNVGEYVVEFFNINGEIVSEVCYSKEQAYEIARQKSDGVTIRKSNLEDVFVKLTGERIKKNP